MYAELGPVTQIGKLCVVVLSQSAGDGSVIKEMQIRFSVASATLKDCIVLTISIQQEILKFSWVGNAKAMLAI